MIVWITLLLAQDTPRPGLIADCRDDRTRVVLTVPTPNFTLAEAESFHPALRPAFQAAFTGLVNIVRAGRYSFVAGEAKILIDGKRAEGPLDLEAGERSIRIEYTRDKPEARLQLLWKSDHFGLEPVPPAVLRHRDRPSGAELQERIERGRDLAESFNCAACHEIDASLRSWKGPDLSTVGSRIRPGWIYRWLDNPRHMKLGGEERAHVTAYLLTRRGGSEPIGPAADPERASRGKDLYESIGCTACHAGDLDGIGSKMSAARLASYLLDPPAVFPDGRMPSMLLTSEEAEAIAEHLSGSRRREWEADPPAGDPQKGRELVSKMGCVSCHAIGDAVPPQRAKLKDKTGGCLERMSRFALDPKECEALAEFLKTSDASPAPGYELHRAARAWRCGSCHEFYAPPAAAFPDPTPTLTDLGAKLRPGAISDVLVRKVRARPWMTLRMPHFREAHAGPLVRGFLAASGAPPDDPTPAPPTAEQLREGVRLIGKTDGGLSCITCHDFAGDQSAGTRGPDMIRIADRVRPEWFRRWMREPSRVQPGTAMPAFFSNLPEAETEKRLDLIWACLSAGKGMPRPEGLADPSAYRLTVKGEPLILRTFMPQSSPRSIAVGCGRLQNYCFDAEGCRLKYAWVGDFLDVSAVWGGRGGGVAKLLGRKYYSAPKIFPIRLGDPEREPRPRFKGYRIVDKLPQFLIDVDGIEVRQRIRPAPEGLGLVLEFEVEKFDGEIWFVAEAQDGVRYESDAGAWENARWKTKSGRFSVTIRVEEEK
jgi:mono/diheme cytochrome c family protein